MGVVMKQFIDRFKAMEKIANETLAANPEALVGVDSLPGSEHDVKVPEEAKKPDAEVAQGLPAGATSTAGAVAGGDAKPLNEGKLEMDEPLLNPERKPMITDEALTAKVANEHLASLVGELLSDLKGGTQKKAAPAGKITLDDETISKLAAAQATFMLGREAAEKALKKRASAQEAAAFSAYSARRLIKDACVKAAQADGLDPAAAAAAADNAMAAAGMPAETVPAAEEAQAAEAPAAEAPAAEAAAAEAAIPDDVTEEELATAIVDLVSSGELDPGTAKALVEEIADDSAAQAPSEDQAAEIIAQGIESGEITPEQAQEIATAIESADAGVGDEEAEGAAAAEAAVQDAQDEAQGAADAEAAVQDAQDEAQGAADAEAAMKSAAAQIRANAISKVASGIAAKRGAQKAAACGRGGSKIMGKVASILQAREAAKTKCASATDEKYIAGFKKKAAELGVDPSALARYALQSQSE